MRRRRRKETGLAAVLAARERKRALGGLAPGVSMYPHLRDQPGSLSPVAVGITATPEDQGSSEQHLAINLQVYYSVFAKGTCMPTQ